MVIHHVVVAFENAAVVGRIFQIPQNVFLRERSLCKISRGPDVLCIQLLRVICAVLFTRTIGAERRRILGRVLLFKIAERTAGIDGNTFFADQIAQDVHIVAALCEDHGTAFSAVSPRSPDIAVRLMIITDVFAGVDVDDLPQRSLVDNFFYFGIEGRIAQNMTDVYPTVVLLCAFVNFQTILFRNGDGLFQKQIVAPVQSVQGVLLMLRVLRGNRHQVEAVALI